MSRSWSPLGVPWPRTSGVRPAHRDRDAHDCSPRRLLSPEGIYRYATDGAGTQGDFHTRVGVVVDLTERRMLLIDGPPRNAEYCEYRLT